MEAVSAGDMFYFLFHFANDPHTIIGSGGLDLNGVQNGESMCSHKSSEFCVMGMFLYERWVRFDLAASLLVDHFTWCITILMD